MYNVHERKEVNWVKLIIVHYSVCMHCVPTLRNVCLYHNILNRLWYVISRLWLSSHMHSIPNSTDRPQVEQSWCTVRSVLELDIFPILISSSRNKRFEFSHFHSSQRTNCVHKNFKRDFKHDAWRVSCKVSDDSLGRDETYLCRASHCKPLTLLTVKTVEKTPSTVILG